MTDVQYVGTYRIAGTLAPGRVAEAYRALDPSGTPVVVKVVEPVDRERFLTQMAAVAQVRHPHVARVLDWGVEGERCFVVQEAVEGVDLAALAAAEPPGATAVAELGAQAAAGLAALHAHGVVHGGVTPLTLVRADDGTLKLTDAGIAPATGPADLTDQAPPENAYFVSPEEVLARGLTRSADIYALGASLYAVATGEVPFDGPNALAVAEQHVGSAPEPPRRTRPELPAALEHVILRAIAKLPEQRHSSAEELRRDLERAAAGMRVAPPAPQPAAIERPGHPVWPWVLGLAIVGALFGALWLSGTFAGTVSVPDVTGMTLEEARATLEDVGLELGGLESGVATPGSPQGTVLEQSPPPGTEVDKGTAVDLVVAGSENVVTPDLAGLTRAEAEAAVVAAGLVVERVIDVYSDDVPAGQVADQTPVAGSTVPAGSPVTISVSLGPEPAQSPGTIAVPDVVGKIQADALAELRQSGLGAVVSELASETVPAGQVIAQAPLAGVAVDAGTTVTLVVSSGPAASPSP